MDLPAAASITDDMKNENLTAMNLKDVRSLWAKYWGHPPPLYIGRKMLEDSIMHKIREDNGEGLTRQQKQKLKELIAAYKRDAASFERHTDDLKPGTKLVRTYKGQRHTVEIISGGYLYNGIRYGSLSKIANEITGTRWNGWRFFGLKKSGGQDGG